MISMAFVNAERILAGLKQLTQAQARAVGGNVYREAEVIMTASKEQCPVDTGALRSTGHVELPAYPSDGTVELKLGYGGVAVGYAVHVHENLNARHTVGNAKFLERPLDAARPALEQAILNGLADAVKGSFR